MYLIKTERAKFWIICNIYLYLQLFDQSYKYLLKAVNFLNLSTFLKLFLLIFFFIQVKWNQRYNYFCYNYLVLICRPQ